MRVQEPRGTPTSTSIPPSSRTGDTLAVLQIAHLPKHKGLKRTERDADLQLKRCVLRQNLGLAAQ